MERPANLILELDIHVSHHEFCQIIKRATQIFRAATDQYGRPSYPRLRISGSYVLRCVDIEQHPKMALQLVVDPIDARVLYPEHGPATAAGRNETVLSHASKRLNRLPWR